MIITFKDVLYKGKTLLAGLLHRDMNLNQAFEILDKVITGMHTSVVLDDVKIADLGIDNTCELNASNLLSAILNELIESDLDIRANLKLISTTVNEIVSNAQQAKDEKVKASDSDPQGGYLKDKLTSPQTGAITYDKEEHKVVLTGFVPVGACFFVSKSRLPDFDGDGKGKPGTDVYGYAIRDGRNGTENVLGSIPRYPADVNEAGKKAGSDKVKLTAKNIPTVEGSVTGTISDALSTKVKPTIKADSAKIGDGAGGNTQLIKVGTGATGAHTLVGLEIDLKHGHGHDLKWKLENPAVEEISILPAHVLEIPIQRINL